MGHDLFGKPVSTPDQCPGQAFCGSCPSAQRPQSLGNCVAFPRVVVCRYDGRRDTGDGYAAGAYSACHRAWRICDRQLQFRRSEFRKNSYRANFGRHELHDGVQFAGGNVPDDLPGPGNRADQRRNHNRQRQSKYSVPGQLLDAADQLSDDLRGNVAFAVTPISRERQRLPQSNLSLFRWQPCQRRWIRRRDGNRASRYGRCAE